MIIRTPNYDKKAFDLDAVKSIFMVDKNGQEDKALASRYLSREEWEEQVVEDTKDAFKNIDPNRMTAKTLDDIDAIAETIYTRVKRGVKMYNAVPLFMNVVKGQLGKTVEAHEISGGKVYNRSYGGFMRVSRLKHETYTVETRPNAVHIQLTVESLKTGRYSVADVVFAATQAILMYKTRLAFDTFVAAYTTGSTGFVTNASSTAITSTVLNGAIDSLADYDVEAITVLGRYSSLTSINDFSGYSDIALEEVRKQGVLGRYRGADVLRLKYIVDETYDTAPFETTSVFLVSNEKNWNRYVEVKPIERSSWLDPADKTMHWVFDFEDGAAIWKLKYGHRIYDVG